MSNLDIKFKISRVSISNQFDILINVRRDLKFLYFSQTVPSNGVGIAYIDFPLVNENNLVLNESVDYLENSNRILEQPRILELESPVFSILHKDFLLTDLFNTNTDGSEVPLFWHDPLERNDGTRDVPISDVSIVDQDMNEVSRDLWLSTVDENNEPVISHALESLAVSSTECKTYYVSYTNSLNENIFRLLKQQPLFVEHTILDGPLTGFRRSYNVKGLASSYSVHVNFVKRDSSGIPVPSPRYYIKVLSSGQVRIKLPSLVDTSKPWHCSFTNGNFYCNVRGEVFTYSLPEYSQQLFVPSAPITVASYEDAYVYGSRLIKTKHSPLLIDIDKKQFYTIIIRDKDGVLKDGYTNDSGALRYVDSNGKALVLRDVARIIDYSLNEEAGFIRLPFDLKETDTVTVKHFYKKTNLEYKDLNLNPAVNRELLDKHIVFYLNPKDSSASYTTEGHKCLNYLLVNGNDEIVDYSRDSNELALDIDVAELTYLRQFKQQFPSKLILGMVNVGRFCAPQDAAITDIRIRGGGLNER